MISGAVAQVGAWAEYLLERFRFYASGSSCQFVWAMEECKLVRSEVASVALSPCLTGLAWHVWHKSGSGRCPSMLARKLFAASPCITSSIEAS